MTGSRSVLLRRSRRRAVRRRPAGTATHWAGCVASFLLGLVVGAVRRPRGWIGYTAVKKPVYGHPEAPIAIIMGLFMWPASRRPSGRWAGNRRPVPLCAGGRPFAVLRPHPQPDRS